jgi:uncharacterized repeat protein (TIGR03803 family)
LGCGGSTNYYSLSASVSGLFGEGPLVLANNNAGIVDTLTLTENTSSATFAIHPADGTNYVVTVQTQPPGQTCTVTNGSGKIRSANVSNISVSCSSVLVDATESLLYSFSPSTYGNNNDITASGGGAQPEAALLQAEDGDFYGTTPYGGQNGVGTVFKITATGIYTELLSFTDAEMGSRGALIQDADGMLYGTGSGGNMGCGNIFKLSTDGSNYSVLHTFEGGSGDGCEPLAGLMLARDGKLYGTTSHGGPGTLDYLNGIGVVFKINTDGTSFSVLHEFDEKGDGELPAAALIQASDDYLYGTTPKGGDGDHGTVFKIATDGTGFSTVYKFTEYETGVDDCEECGYGPTSAVMQAADGNLYGTTRDGGSERGGVVFKITLAGVESILYEFAAGSEPKGGLIQAADGNLYGTTYRGGGEGKGSLFSLTTAGVYALLHSFTDSPDGKEPAAGVTQSATDGHLYGTTREGGDDGMGVVFKY